MWIWSIVPAIPVLRAGSVKWKRGSRPILLLHKKKHNFRTKKNLIKWMDEWMNEWTGRPLKIHNENPPVRPFFLFFFGGISRASKMSTAAAAAAAVAFTSDVRGITPMSATQVPLRPARQQRLIHSYRGYATCATSTSFLNYRFRILAPPLNWPTSAFISNTCEYIYIYTGSISECLNHQLA